MNAALAFDAVLCVLIAGAAVSAVAGRDLFARIVFFIVYGLLMAIAWVRLEAPDVALAEAAIGAGLTGVLFLAAAARMRDRQKSGVGPRWWSATALAAGAVIAAVLMLAVQALPETGAGLGALAQANLPAAGVANPVTAVLLNYRALDTLLEAVVLLFALLGVWSLTRDRFWGGMPGIKQHARPDGALVYLGRLLPPAGLVVAVYVLWAGTAAPGGAFQAGTILAAVWLLAAMAGLTDAPPVSSRRLRLVLIAGPAFFLAVATGGALAGTFLGYHVAVATPLILTIEVLLTLSIAATLAMLVRGVPLRPI